MPDTSSDQHVVDDFTRLSIHDRYVIGRAESDESELAVGGQFHTDRLYTILGDPGDRELQCMFDFLGLGTDDCYGSTDFCGDP